MPAGSFIETAGRRLAREWRAKALLFVLLFAAFGVPYFVLQRWPLLTPGRFELTALDRWVGFQPAWVWVYQSAYLVIVLPPFFAATREELGVYARGFLAMTGVAVLFYVLMPIEAPRPLDVPHTGMWGMLLSYDRTINTFPSLHVAMVAHALCFAGWMGKEAAGAAREWMRAGLTVGVAWLLLIAYSTLATKQHYFVDLPAGVVLGVACQWVGVRLSVAKPVLEGRTA